MYVSRIVVFVLLAGAAWSHDVAFTPPVNGNPHPWSHLDFAVNPDDFQFVIFSDRTGGMRPGVFEDGVRKVNLLQPEFSICIGDLVEGNAKTDEELNAQWDEFDGIVAALDAPFFYVPGNHDVSNSPMGPAVWERRYGPQYYRFLYKNTLFLCLNSDDTQLQHIGPDQLAFVERTLEEHKEVRWTFVFMHKPLWAYKDASNWDKVEALLADRDHTVFTGHTHEYLKYDRNQRDYFVLGTTGGGMAHGGPLAGEFDHVVWVTMKNGEPIFANLMLSGIADKNIRTDADAQLRAPVLAGEVIASTPFPYSGGPLEIRLINPSKIPLSARGLVQAPAGTVVSPMHIAATVPPDSMQKIAVQVAGTGNGRQPIRTTWVFSQQSAEGRKLDTPLLHWLVPDEPHAVISTPQSIVIDGNIDEWGTLELACAEPAQAVQSLFGWEGPADASFQFDVRNDNGDVVVAANIVDDSVIPMPGRNENWQDSIVIRIDARPMAERIVDASIDDKSQSEYLWLALSPDEDGGVYVHRRESLPEGVEAQAVRTAEGYAMEARIPQAYLRSKQGTDSWTSFRMNVAIVDVDREGETGVRLYWRPDWRSPANIPAAGMFEKP
ncbi:MAG: hypothetical protein AMXMBFR84_34460 [Candidatus Hydrogenedentota bacterium]